MINLCKVVIAHEYNFLSKKIFGLIRSVEDGIFNDFFGNVFGDGRAGCSQLYESNTIISLITMKDILNVRKASIEWKIIITSQRVKDLIELIIMTIWA